ncbi:MAG: hypothetical protein V7K50_21830 [Nostoc sp.]
MYLLSSDRNYLIGQICLLPVGEDVAKMRVKVDDSLRLQKGNRRA